VRYGLLAWTRVSANSEKDSGSEWDVRVGKRLLSRFGKSRVARKLGLVQIIVKLSEIRAGFQNTWQSEPCLFLAGAVVAFWVTMRRGFSFQRRAINYTFLRRRIRGTHEFITSRSAEQLLFHGR